MAAGDADRPGGMAGSVTSSGAAGDLPKPPTQVAPELPPEIRRLWAGADRPRRGPKPALTLDQITAAAIDLADREGLPAVSMARLAEALGYSTMALYRYVSGKDELLLLMSDGVADDPPDLSGASNWREALEIWAMDQIGMVLGRPWFLELPLAGVLPGPRRMRWIDAAFGALATVDAPFDTKLRAIGLMAQHVLGEARVTVESQRTAASAAARAEGLPVGTPVSEIPAQALAAADPYVDFETVIARYADPEHYPALFAAIEEAAGDIVQPPAHDWREEAAIGINVMLDGIELLLKRSRRG